MKRAILWGIASILLLASCYQGHGLSPPEETSGIEGRITFIGAWPDSTKEVRIAVLKNFPEGMTDPDSLLNFVITNLSSLSDPLPMGIDHHDYQLLLDPGHYAWVLVVWLPANLFGIKELGAYYLDPNNLTLPTPITVLAGVLLQGIDIVADFANVHNEKPFFKRESMP
ncbi:MAG: hypothetical protein ABIL68_02245 [bacterium]